MRTEWDPVVSALHTPDLRLKRCPGLKQGALGAETLSEYTSPH